MGLVFRAGAVLAFGLTGVDHLTTRGHVTELGKLVGEYWRVALTIRALCLLLARSGVYGAKSWFVVGIDFQGGLGQASCGGARCRPVGLRKP